MSLCASASRRLLLSSSHASGCAAGSRRLLHASAALARGSKGLDWYVRALRRADAEASRAEPPVFPVAPLHNRKRARAYVDLAFGAPDDAGTPPPPQRVVFELADDIVPITVANFLTVRTRTAESVGVAAPQRARARLLHRNTPHPAPRCSCVRAPLARATWAARSFASSRALRSLRVTGRAATAAAGTRPLGPSTFLTKTLLAATLRRACSPWPPTACTQWAPSFTSRSRRRRTWVRWHEGGVQLLCAGLRLTRPPLASPDPPPPLGCA